MAPATSKHIQRRAGVTPRMLHAWREGRSRATLTQVLCLCDVLEMTVAELLGADASTIRRQLEQVTERM